MNLTSYHAKIFAFELTRRHSANDLGKLTASLQDARVDLNPHQVDAALFAFKSPLSKGAILADEVGLGKTIEAGIILSQKWAERKRKLLIICPANLRKQWSQELIDKFYLPSIILEARSFNQKINEGNLQPFNQPEIIICSYQFACSKAPYGRQIDWDLVIIDEAHRLRNVYKPSNKIANVLKSAFNHVPKILLTATPLQNQIEELFGLVSIIDEYTFGDIKSFKSQFSKPTEEGFYELKKRLEPICKRTLRKHVTEYINFTKRIAIVEEFWPFPEEEQLYDEVSEYLRRPALYALPVSQRALMTLVLRKLLASSTYAIHDTFKALENKLVKLLADQKPAEDEFFSQEFETFDELKDEWEYDEAQEIVLEKIILSDDQIEEANSELLEIKRFREMAYAIRKNSKGEKLFTALEKGFEKLSELGASQKALIFTESTRTQQYLKNILEARGYEGKIVLFNGSNTDPHSISIYNDWVRRHQGTDKISGSRTADTRQAIVDWFRNEATIMIATEAASEGINLQFCSLIVNYDLPWNPQRIEQRIGRCHRYGQKFDVVVVNFLNKSNAADQRVYTLLDEKFKLFSDIFEASDEVLGIIESGGIDFEKRIARIYQECRKEEDIKSAFDSLQKELEVVIDENIKITHKMLLENFDLEVQQKLRLNLAKGISQFEQWLWDISKFYLQDFATFDHQEDSFRLVKNPFPSEKINPGPYRILRSTAEKKKTEVEVDEDTNIFRVGHPLAQRIIEACKKLKTPTLQVVFDYTGGDKKITVLEDLVGQSGWMRASLFSISSFETEEHVVLSGVSDTGLEVDPEIVRLFFHLEASELDSLYIPEEASTFFASQTESQLASLLQENMERNGQFFEEEYGKLDKWAEDMKLSLEREIKDLDSTIKLKKAESRKISELASKISFQRSIKELEKKRNDKRRTLFESQDQVDHKKETLLSDVEARLKQQTSLSPLFTLNWKII